MKNIYIEGIQGMGKSTLIKEIAAQIPALHMCMEGDYSPVDLAWCTWMSEKDYKQTLQHYSSLQEEIRKNTFKEENHYIITYTKILTDIPGFHKDLERFEIYNGRVSLQELETIILSRYQNFSQTGYLFECSFFQNIIEDLILFHQLSDTKIMEFYERLYEVVKNDDFLLLYLYSDQLEETISGIKKERCDALGNEMWYSLMNEFLIHSPYGKQHGYKGFEDMISHFRHRQKLELRIIHEILLDHALILPAKNWKIEEILSKIQTNPAV